MGEFGARCDRARASGRVVNAWLDPDESGVELASRLAEETVRECVAGGRLSSWHVETLASVAEPFLAAADEDVRTHASGSSYPRFLRGLQDALRRAEAERAPAPDCFALADAWLGLAARDDPFFPTQIKTSPVSARQVDVADVADVDLARRTRSTDLHVSCSALDRDEAETRLLAASLTREGRLPPQVETTKMRMLLRALDEPNRAAREICDAAVELRASTVSTELRRLAEDRHHACFPDDGQPRPPRLDDDRERRAYEHAADLWRALVAARQALGVDPDPRAAVVAHVVRALAFYVGAQLRLALVRLDADLAVAGSRADAAKATHAYLFSAGLAHATFSAPILRPLRAQVDAILHHALHFLAHHPGDAHRCRHYPRFYAAVIRLLRHLHNIRGLPPHLLALAHLLDWDNNFFFRSRGRPNVRGDRSAPRTW